MIGRVLFRLARSRPMGVVVRFGFAHLSGLLPVHRIGESAQIVAFYHPRPAWQPHVLFVPKVGIPSLLDVRPEQVPLVRALIQRALKRGASEGFPEEGFAVLVNGGAYQDVGQLHFHLAGWSGETWYACPDEVPSDTPPDLLLETERLVAFHHPRPQRAVHVVLRSRSGHVDSPFVDDAILATQTLVRRLDLLPTGYTLLANVRPGDEDQVECFHLVSGS